MYLVALRVLILFAILMVVYIGLSAYDRYLQREKLKSEHMTGEGGGLSQEDYVHKGLANYERSWRRKLLYGVFVLPFMAILLLVYIANYQ
ncbi:MAG: hypothetical protein AAF415_01475 [Pseudomonadota bacterium]